MIRFSLAAALLATAPAIAQDAPDQAALKAHVQFLASDQMRGREAGTPDYEIAAEYVAAQMLMAGLKPAGDKGWFQPLRLASYKSAERGQVALTIRNAQVELKPGTDFILYPNPASAQTQVAGAVVFAGHGLVYPQGGIDDYKGLDVRGKIVAVLAGLPTGLPNAVEAHFGDADAKAQLAQMRGAKGVIVLETPASAADFPLSAMSPFWNYSFTSWADPAGKVFTPAPQAPVLGLLGMAAAEKLFANSRIKWADVLAAAKAGRPIRRGPLAASVTVNARTEVTFKPTRNVLGMIEGSDPVLKNEVLVLSAHLDHVGVGRAVGGDTIYNGALDNALGVGTILEVAKAFQASGTKPRRSILFIALAAEEKGLIGSSYFANLPTVPKNSIVADLNIDMPIMTYPLEDLVVLGGERSSLGPALAAAAATEGLKTVPDPAPEEMFFVRSDHYSFVKAGVPAVSIDSGPGGAGEKAQREFLAKHYHKPSDEITLPIDWSSAAKFTRVNYAAARAIADADARPSWNKGDFFGTLFEGYGAK